jgi:hypothetical protein
MRLRKTVSVALSVSVAAVLSFASVGTATAAPVSHPKSAYPQVSGTRLASALLPATAFGEWYFEAKDQLNTGVLLLAPEASVTPTRLTCENWEEHVYAGGWGNTAGAEDAVVSEYPFVVGDTYPNLTLAADQNVVQFATPKAAATYYNQAYAKDDACQSVTTNGPTGLGGTQQLTNQSLVKTTIGGNQAFNLVENSVFSLAASDAWYKVTVVVLSGTDVYTITEFNGTNDPIEPSLVTQLIKQTQALYR